MVSRVLEKVGARFGTKAGCLIVVAVAIVALLNVSSQAAKPAAYIETVKTANDSEQSFRTPPLPGRTLTIALPVVEPYLQDGEVPQH